MGILLLESLLLIGLVLFIFVVQDGLSRIASEKNSLSDEEDEESGESSLALQFVQADNLLDPIGHYLDLPIYQYAIIHGKKYRFEFVYPGKDFNVAPEQCVLSPGLVYMPYTNDRT